MIFSFPGAFTREWQLIIFLALAKLLIHLFTMYNFELHRDAYLYYTDSQHLAWDYLKSWGLPIIFVFLITIKNNYARFQKYIGSNY